MGTIMISPKDCLRLVYDTESCQVHDHTLTVAEWAVDWFGNCSYVPENDTELLIMDAIIQDKANVIAQGKPGMRFVELAEAMGWDRLHSEFQKKYHLPYDCPDEEWDKKFQAFLETKPELPFPAKSPEGARTIEQRITDAVTEKLNDGTLETIIAKKTEEALNDAIKSIFGYSGKGKELLEKKLESLMVPAIEKYDFGEYVQKLDFLLAKLAEGIGLGDYAETIRHFTEFTQFDAPEEMVLEDLFDLYCDYAAKEVDTSCLEVDTDDEPTYCPINCRVTVEEHAYDKDSLILKFRCEEDEKLSHDVRIWNLFREKKARYNVYIEAKDIPLNSLRKIGTFQLELIRLASVYTDIIGVSTENFIEEEIEVEAEPECDWN